ncbi:hypothetical protein Rt10032_c01g0334 [Rhodotorula toruloides]|uniref:Uncharacterized protein n=1 Tax=Rhodotorula toruloides TaxID=5286 RepID=A0A511K7P3_RHOTO|nr:hypothetical protein Rt10032_c01g0334 [Rhodotorula toruloides]
MIPPDAGWALPPSAADDADPRQRSGRAAVRQLWAHEGIQASCDVSAASSRRTLTSTASSQNAATSAEGFPRPSADPYNEGGIRGRLGAYANLTDVSFVSGSAGTPQPDATAFGSSGLANPPTHLSAAYPPLGEAPSNGGPFFASNGTQGEAPGQTMLPGYPWPAYPPTPVIPSSQARYFQGWQGWQAAVAPTSDSRATVAGLGHLHPLPDSSANTPVAAFFPSYNLAPTDSQDPTNGSGSSVEAMPESPTAFGAAQYSPFTFDAQQQQSMQALLCQYSTGRPGTAISPDPSCSTAHSLPPPLPYPPADAPVDPAATTFGSTGLSYYLRQYPIVPPASAAHSSASRPLSTGRGPSFPTVGPFNGRFHDSITHASPALLPDQSLPLTSLPPSLPSPSALPFRSQAEPPSSNAYNTDLFASKRTRRASSAATATGMNLPAALGQAGDMVKANSNPNKKLTVDLPAVCVVCSEPIARLICRGKRAELNVPHAAAFTCVRCWESSNEASPMAEYSPDTTIAALPAEDAGSPPVAGPSRRPSIARAKGPSFRRRNKRLDDRSTPTACDVCLRDIAVGGVLPLPLDAPPANARIAFMIEVVCSSCDSRYRRCTDCGGGGGARAGTGKWRAKELFVQNRKTCVLNHQRLGAFPAMEYSVWRNTEIPRDEVDELLAQLKVLFVNAMLAGLCIPEIMEQDGAIWTTYAEAAEHAQGGWFGFDPILRNDIESTYNIRRYLALRTCTPNLRKTSRPTKSKASDASTSESPEDVRCSPLPSVGGSKGGTILKEGREIAGFVLAESELSAGSLFLALVLPWDPTGEIFDATSLMLSSLVQRADADIRALNADKLARGEAPIPNLQHVWTMLFFKPSSRVLSSLIKKRGFMLLEDYLQAYPDTPATLFPPHRQIYLPADRQQGWTILVRRQREHSDGTFLDDWGVRRAADEERGKKKEIRAAAVAARERQQRNSG